MIHRIITCLGAGLLLFGLLAVPARAQSPEAEIREMLEQRDQEIKRLVNNQATLSEAQREQLKDVINDVIDFETMGRQALGPFWSQMTEAQRTEFLDLFSTIVREQSLSDVEIYNSQVTYEEIDVTGDSAYVRTLTVYKDRPTKVEYILGRNGDTWRVHDLILDEASTVEAYERSFQSVARKKGIEALLTSLRKKRDEIVASS